MEIENMDNVKDFNGARKQKMIEGPTGADREQARHFEGRIEGTTFVRAVIQYTDVLRDPSLYEFEIPERSKNLFGQFLFAYKINPATAFYLGYDDEYVSTDQFQTVEVGRTVFVKFGYAWVP